MKNFFTMLLLLTFHFSLLTAVYSDAYISVHVDRSKITIGAQIKLTITVEFSNNVKFRPFNFEENLKSFEIKDYKISKDKKRYLFFGKNIKKFEYLLSTFTTGIYEIKPFAIDFTDTDGKPASGQTQPLKIEVVSLLDKESASDIRDIKPPVNLKVNPVFYFVILGLLLLFLVGYFIYRHRSQKRDFSQIIADIVDPYKHTIGELKKLENMDLIKKGMVKEFFIRLTQIIRIYLSKIFSVNIMDMTTTESLRALRERNADRKFLIKLQEFLEHSDLVKFAKYIPEEKEILSDFEDAKNIVEMVRPEPQMNTGEHRENKPRYLS